MSRPLGIRRPLRVAPAPAGAALVAVAVAVSGCAGGSTEATDGSGHAGASTRPAAKETCPDVAWVPPASLVVEQVNRELVPFGPTLLGVESTWRGDGFTVQTVSGGYVDDLTEAYDNLQVTGTLDVRGASDADVMHGTLQGSPVVLVLWRDQSHAVPCDVRAFLVLGADPTTEALLVQGLG